jgi:hypothetical protein
VLSLSLKSQWLKVLPLIADKNASTGSVAARKGIKNSEITQITPQSWSEKGI